MASEDRKRAAKEARMLLSASCLAGGLSALCSAAAQSPYSHLPWVITAAQKEQATFEAEHRKIDEYWEALLEMDKDVQQAVSRFLYDPPPPINGGWGHQPHIEACNWKYQPKSIALTGWKNLVV